MKLLNVTVGGYKNVEHTKLTFDKIIAIVSPNNYGKSNLLSAIDFGIDFIDASPKMRSSMMSFQNGIPLNKTLDHNDYYFEMEFENRGSKEYKYVKYGYSFRWVKDDKSGRRILDEWLEMRASTSVKYTSYIKRCENKYRGSKKTSSFRKMKLNRNSLAIDMLSVLADIDIFDVARKIKSFEYHICSSLDLDKRFRALPFEFGDSEEFGFEFDEYQIPKMLYILQKDFPEKYALFLEAIYDLFPDFTDFQVEMIELNEPNPKYQMVISKVFSSKSNEEDDDDIDEIPFRISEKVYRAIVTSKVLNQPINISLMSSGTKRIIWLLASIFAADSNSASLLAVEELETSIHPKLLKRLLEVINESLVNVNIIVSSHSPYLIQYIKPTKIYIGIPNNTGIAEFKRIKQSKSKAILSAARDYDMSVGEYIFDLISNDIGSAQILNMYLEE